MPLKCTCSVHTQLSNGTVEQPLVSVLTPSFNQGTWLRDNLNSVAAQSYKRIEHVVVDGGSSDATLIILRSSGSNVNWISEGDRGQSHALNKAFSRSNGEILGWLNSDDAYVDRRAVEKAVEVFLRHPEVGVVYGHSLAVTNSNRFMQVILAPSHADSLMPVANFLTQPSVFVRRSVIPDWFVDEDLSYVMDLDLWWRLRSVTSFRRIPLIVALDRDQPDRKSRSDLLIDEANRYEFAHSKVKSSAIRQLVRRASKAALRWRGLPLAVRLPGSIDPALPIEYGSISNRIVRQSLIPKARMRSK